MESSKEEEVRLLSFILGRRGRPLLLSYFGYRLEGYTEGEIGFYEKEKDKPRLILLVILHILGTFSV